MLWFILLVSSAVHAQSVKPGIWQADSNFKVVGFDLPASKDEECITPDQAKDLKSTLTKELTAQGCTVTKWTAKGKKVDIALKCSKSGLEATGTLTGTVDNKSYQLAGKADGSFNQIPTTADISLKGHWVKDCPKKP